MRYPSLPLINTPVTTTSSLDTAWAALGQELAPAMTSLAEAVSASVASQDRRSEVVARLGLAEGQRRIAADRNAVDLAIEALDLVETLDDRPLRFSARLVLSVAAWDHVLLNEALAALDHPDAQPVTPLEEATAAVARARILRYRSEHHQARSLTESAQEVLARDPDPDAFADSNRELAADLLMLGEFETAREAAVEALAHHRSTGDLFRAAQALTLISRSYRSAEYDDQLAGYKAALDLASDIGSPSLESMIRIHIAQRLQTGATPDTQRWRDAMAHLDRAEELSVDALSRSEILTTRAYLEVARFDPNNRAEDLLDEAAEILTSIGNVSGLATIEKARARIRVRIASNARGPAKLVHLPLITQAYLRAARLYRRTGMHATAQRIHAEEHLAARLVSGFGLNVAEAEALLGRTDPRDQRDRARAILVLADALLESRPGRKDRKRIAAMLVEADHLATQVSDHLLIAAVRFGIAELQVATGETRLAAESLRHGLQILGQVDVSLVGNIGRARFVDFIEPITRRALRTAIALGDAWSGIQLLEVRRSGRLAGLLRRRARVAIDPEIASLLGRIEQRRAFDAGPLRGVESPPSIGDGPASEIRAELAQRTSDAFAEVYDPEPIDLDALFERIPDHVDVLIVDQLDPSNPAEIVVASVRGSGAQAEAAIVTLPAETVELLRLLATDDRASDQAKADLLPKDLSGLGHLFPADLRSRLDRTTGGDLLIVPSGLLWTVPWAGVPLDSDRLLVDVASVTVAPSLRVHALADVGPVGPMTGPVLTWAGDLRRPDGLPELEVFAERGLEVVRPSTSGALVEMIADSRSFSAVALAVHGDAESGLAHGVQLGGEHWLRAFELIGAQLSPYLFLGACHSAFAAGDEPAEPIGLPTVALCAGAASVIAASTKIPDSRGTSELLARIYALMIEGHHPARAIRSELLARLDSGGRDQMLLAWAPITAIGTAPVDAAA